MSFAFPWSTTRAVRAKYSLVVLLFVAAIVGMSVASAATFMSGEQNVSNDPDVNSTWSEVAQDPNGNIHVVWDSQENGYTIRYAKGTWNGSSYDFGGSQVVGGAHPTGFAQPSVAVAPNGMLMVAWSNQDKAISFRTWNSAGASVGGQEVVLAGGIQPSIAVDSESDFHLVWSADFNANYREISTTRGIISTALFGGDLASAPDITVDSSNNAHVVWQRSGQVVQYAARTAGAVNFGAVQTIAGGTNPQIAADGLGNVHIVRSQNSDIVYCSKTISTGCQDSRVLDAATDLQPTIGATRVGSVFIAFRAAGSVWYDALENGVWQTSRELPGGGGGVQVDVSSRPYTSRVSVVWNEGYDIEHNFARTTPGIVCGTSAAEVGGSVSASSAGTRIYLPLIMRSEPPQC